MALIRKEIEVEAQVGDMVKLPSYMVSRDDINICHIEGDLLYISDTQDSPRNDCQSIFAEDCYLR